MKNSASTIGIIPLAGMAKVLEDAARNDEIDVLQVMTPIFLEHWYSYQERLAIFMPVSEVEEKKAANDFEAEIEELVRTMNVAAEEMDIDALDEIWMQLAKYQFGEDKQEILSKIHKAIVEFDIDYLQTVKKI